MRKLIVLASLSFAAAALAAGKDPAKPAGSSSSVMKDLVKDAVDTSGGKDARGSLDPNVKPPPDVTKMPFTQDSIKQVVAYHQPQIQGCYEETLAGKEKAVEGRLLTSFVITGEGMVKDAKVEKRTTTLKDPKLHECVVTVISTMTFPKPVDGRDHPIEFPFNLKAIH